MSVYQLNYITQQSFSGNISVTICYTYIYTHKSLDKQVKEN